MQPDFIPNSAQLRSVWLEGVVFRENQDFDLAGDTARYSLDIDHDVIVPEEEDAADRAFITVDLSVNWTTEGLSPFELTMQAGASFGWAEAWPADRRRRWTDYNGVYLVWPYMRAWTATITGFSGSAPFMVPTLAVPRPEPWTLETGEHAIGDEEGQPFSAG